MDASEEEICGEFKSLGVVVRNPDVIDKLREICIVYKVSGSDLAEHWFAFATSNGMDCSDPTVDRLSKLENEEFSSRRRSNAGSKSILSTPNDTSRHARISDESLRNEDSDRLFEAYGTPDICAAKKRQRTPDSASNYKRTSLGGEVLATRQSIDAASPVQSSQSPGSMRTQSVMYANRTNAGDVLCTFGQQRHLPFGQVSEGISTVLVKAYGDDESVLKECYKYMFLKTRLIAAILNDRIEEMTIVLREAHDIQDLFAVGQSTVDEVIVIGMIACDGNGRLNPSSILLQGSLETSDGVDMQLDVSNLPGYSLFPGQIVAVSGSSNSGKCFVGSKLLPNVVAPFADIPTTFADGFVSFIVSCGPYRTADSMSYDPLCDLLKIVTDEKPHVCILIGPFVDAKQTYSDDCLETFGDIFTRCVELILNCARRSSTQFVIVPSIRDAHHDYIYPTPPFACSKTYSNIKNVHFVSDPCVLDIAGVVLGITSTDVLMHLGREEISFPAMPDRLARLASHLLQQRSFYPIYPPSEEMNVDYDKFESVGHLPITPHVLILPSDLTCFVKDVNGCCCINPQRITRGSSGGSYARIRIESADSTESSSFISRLSCQILRI